MNKATASAVVATMLVAGQATAAELPDISQGWRFHKGDDPAWADPTLDDSGWQAIEVGADWDGPDGEDYDGFGWYRLRFRLPEGLKEDRDFAHYGELKLELGSIDDVDRTYLNGELVGEMGSLPPAFKGDWQTPRRYTVPAGLLRWDEDNVIAVRVFDNNGGGGMYQGPYALRIPDWQDHLKLRADVGRGDGIFVEEDALPVAVVLDNATYEDMVGTVAWRWRMTSGTCCPRRPARSRSAQAQRSGRSVDSRPRSRGSTG